MHAKFSKEPIPYDSPEYKDILAYTDSEEGIMTYSFLETHYLKKFDTPTGYSSYGTIESVPVKSIVTPYGGIIAVLYECLHKGILWQDLLGYDDKDLFTCKECFGKTAVELMPERFKNLPPIDATQDDIYCWFHNRHKEL